MTRTYDDWKTTDPADAQEPRFERDPDAEYDTWRDEQMQKRYRGLQNAVEVMREVEAYLDNRADINDAGGPNEAMRMLTEVRAAIRKLEGR